MQSSPEKVLVRGVNWLGDAVMTTPALLRLRAARPQAHITLLTPAKLGDLWPGHPAIDAVLAFTPEEGPLAVARRLRPAQFDLALVLPNSPRSALEPFLAGIPRRIGYARPWRNLFLTERVAARPEERRMQKLSRAGVRRRIQGGGHSSVALPPGAHHLHQYLHLAAALGANPEPLPPLLRVDQAEVDAVRVRFGIPEGPARVPLVGLNPGAEYGPAKRWPQDRFIAAAIELHRRTGCHFWIFGGKADESLASGIARGIVAGGQLPVAAVRCLAGQTSLRELCAALKACDVLITNDTGPMHVAAAVGTRVVVPFGSTSPELTGPGLPGDGRHRFLQADAPCAPCFLRECPIDFRCMIGISVERVVTAAVQAIG